MSSVIGSVRFLAKAYIIVVMMFKRPAGEHFDICKCPHWGCESLSVVK